MVYPSAMDFFGCSRCKLSDIKPNFSELARFYNLDRRQRLADYYNENFNAIRPREYTTRTHDSLKKVIPHSCYFSDELSDKK